MMSYEALAHHAGAALREAAQAIENTDEFTANYKLKAGTALKNAAELYQRSEWYKKQADEKGDDNARDAERNFYYAASNYAVAARFWDFVTLDYDNEEAQDEALEKAPEYEAKAKDDEYAGEKAARQNDLVAGKAWANNSQADDEEEQAEAKSQRANEIRRQANRIEAGNPEGAAQLHAESKELLRQVRRHRREASYHRDFAERAKVNEAKAAKAEKKAS